MIRRLAVLPAMLAVAAGALAEEPGLLTTERLLESSRKHYPAIVQSLAMQREATARAMEAEGAFDLVFDAELYSRASGFYDGTALSGKLTQRLGDIGASVYTGYKLSNGTFPVYEDERFTNTGGAVRVGALFSLLKDREIDAERFRRRDVEFEVQEAEFNVLLTRIGVQQRALNQYWNWVTIGRKLRVYENLLRIARERQEALEEQVRRGARARIFLTENDQNIIRRQTLVATAIGELARAANTLSIYYRDENGNPLIPQNAQLPPGVQLNDVDPRPLEASLSLSKALQDRPELALLRNELQRESNRLKFRENALLPTLDVGVELQKGFGATAEGGPSRDGTDTVVGVTFSVPLQRRAAKAKVEQSRAILNARRAEEQLREERIRVEIRNLVIDLELAKELLSLTAREVRQSELLRASELRRFDGGASDFFLINLREEAAADARIRLLEAELMTRLARANLDAASVNVEFLGLEDQ